MMIYRSVLVIVVLMMVLGTTATAQSLFIRENSAMQDEISIAEIRSLSFEPGSLILTSTSGDDVSFMLEDLSNLSFMVLTSAAPRSVPQESLSSFQLYPNPANRLLNFRFSEPSNSNWRLEIISVGGRTMHVQEIEARTTAYQIDISELPGGFYICRIHNSSFTETLKFLKQ